MKNKKPILAVVLIALAAFLDYYLFSVADGNFVKRILLLVLTDLTFVYVFIRWDKIVQVPVAIHQNRTMVFRLARNDFKTKFSGSYLGIVWAFIQPIVTVFVYWFVFEKALNAGTQSTKAGITVPFVLFLIAGLVPWFYFSDTLNTGTNSLLEYSFLVKKVVFNVTTLPFVKVISNVFVHCFFLLFILLMYAFYGLYPTPAMIQIFYYSFCMMCLVTGCVYLTSAIVVFFRDLSQFINIFLQVLVWATPIMWNFDAVGFGNTVKSILKLNPMFYVIMGYRDALINEEWFWTNPVGTIYFWIVTLLIFAVGTSVFEKLKPHFADVL